MKPLDECEEDYEIEQHWRSWAYEQGWEELHISRDRFAQFMTRQMPEADKSYARKWLISFQRGQHFGRMDLENKKEYVKMLVEKGDLTEDVLVEALGEL